MQYEPLGNLKFLCMIIFYITFSHHHTIQDIVYSYNVQMGLKSFQFEMLTKVLIIAPQ